MEEIWKNIPNYEEYYQASNMGRIKSISRKFTNAITTYIKKEKILKPYVDRAGYYHIDLRSKSFSVHRIILLTFIGYSELQCNHKNGIKKDNRLENLEYCTCSENLYHAYKNGLKKTKKIKCNETGIIYKSIRYAEYVFNCKNREISEVLRGKRKKFNNNTFSYVG
jgi:hypothetical protein